MMLVRLQIILYWVQLQLKAQIEQAGPELLAA